MKRDILIAQIVLCLKPLHILKDIWCYHSLSGY